MVSTLQEAMQAWWGQLGWLSYLCMGAMVLLGAFMQGVGGLGYAMFCAPLAAIFFPQLVPGPLLTVGAPLALLAYWREPAALNGRVAASALVGRVLGTGLAVGALLVLSGDVLAVCFALLILLAVALSAGGWQVQPSARNVGVAGVASGVMGTITAAGGPPFAVAMQHLPAAVIRSTLGVVFFAGTLVSVAALVAVGRMGALQWLDSLALMPWMLLGFAASTRWVGKVSKEMVRRWLLVTAVVSALVILARALWA